MPGIYIAPDSLEPQLRRPYFAGHRSSYLEPLAEEELEILAKMDEPPDLTRPKSHSTQIDQLPSTNGDLLQPPQTDAKTNHEDVTPGILDDSSADYLVGGSSSLSGLNDLPTPTLSRTGSSNDLETSFNDPFIPPVDRLTIFDILENFALPQRLERMQNAIHDNAERLRRQRAKLTSRVSSGKNNLVGKWKKAGVAQQPEEQLEKYRSRMRESVDRLSKRWKAAKTVTMNEKLSFVSAVLNIFISGYLIGAWPEYFHYWYTIQLAYFMPIRWYKYHKIGYHYFLADLCYFVNFLLILSIWFFPQSKRLFISTYCLAFGNNAVAIVMWRNSLVFHSLDKVTSLFIHIMPCATLHVLVHLLPPELQLSHFPAIHTIKFSPPTAPEHYTLTDMIIWATLPYAIWQLSYHLLITVRKSSKIAAGRPTSFTWLRKSYSGNFLGKFVLSFPEPAQEGVFMAIQYTYALLTMLPCPIWFWYRWASAGFMMVVFTWASWNGATYYIDVFGRRMEKELEGLRKEVQRLEAKSPEMSGMDGVGMWSPIGLQGQDGGVGRTSALDLGPAAAATTEQDGKHRRTKSDTTDEGSVDGEVRVSEGLTMVNGFGEGKKDG